MRFLLVPLLVALSLNAFAQEDSPLPEDAPAAAETQTPADDAADESAGPDREGASSGRERWRQRFSRPPGDDGERQWREPRLRPQPGQPRSPEGASGEMIPNIQFPNADVRAVLDFYEKLTGKRPLYDGTVQGQVNIVVTRPVTYEEAVRIIETALLINGFTLVPGPGDIVKVLGPGKNARQFGVPILSDFNALPENDQIVSFLFRLDYADPVEVQQAITPYVAPSPYTWFLPMPKSQSILITESSGVIRMLAKVIEELDKPPAEVISEFFSLKRADAADVVEKLTKMFETPADQATRQPPPSNPGQPPPNAAGSSAGVTLSENSLIVGKINLTADVRTNRIHVVTRPVNLPFIRRLIAEYDSDVSFGEPMTRQLRFVAAGEVLDVIVDAIREPGVKVEETTATPTSRTGTTTSQTSSSTSGGVSLGTEELATPEADTAPVSKIVGSTRIIADKRANTIIVLGNDDVKNKISRVIDEIDIRAPQVMLTAVVGELILNEDEEFGVDYIQSLGRESVTTTDANGNVVTVNRAARGFAGIARNTAAPIIDIRNLTDAASLAAAGGGVTAFIGITNSLEMIVRALEGTGRFRITSRPMVFTSNNKKAIITSGQQVAVPQNTTTGFNAGDLVTTASVSYKDVVLKLEVLPLINSENEVTLDIIQEVNSINGYTVVGENSIPTINARKIKTTVTVANEATIVLGGLVQETKEKSRSIVPVLGNIPLLGKLFSHEKEALRRTELVVLLRPTVTHTPTDAVIAGEKAQERLALPPDLEATLDPPGARVDTTRQQPKVQMRTRQAPPRYSK